MGLSNFPCLAEGVLPVLVINTVLSVVLLKNLLRSALQVIGAAAAGSENFEDNQLQDPYETRERRVSITQFKSLCNSTVSRSSNNGGGGSCGVECSVCLCRFEAEEEVSELSCKHFFHKSCLDKWFHNKHTTCPLCRSIQ